MQLTFASYNIRKAIGVDRRRDPDRILAILREIDADVVALQEADRRFGAKASALPFAAIAEHSPYKPVALATQPGSIGWHGNAILVRRNIAIAEAAVVPLPAIEPRGAVRADLSVGGTRIRVVGLHLDLSGLRRRQQLRSILQHIAECDRPCPTLLLGDFNDWAAHGGCYRELGAGWRVLAPGKSFPSRHPVARLDRIAMSIGWRVVETHVHDSALAMRGSDHLPVIARLELPVF